MSIEEIKVGKNTIKIEIDSEPQNPRTDWEPFGTITTKKGGRYYLGEKPMDAEDMERIYNNKKEYISLPVYAYIHSGTCLNTTGFSCPWDSGQSGIIYISKDKVRKEFRVKRISLKLFNRIEEILRGEVETFSQYLGGEVYGFIIEDLEGEILDSCWGFYELENCKSEAVSMANYYLPDAVQTTLCELV